MSSNQNVKSRRLKGKKRNPRGGRGRKGKGNLSLQEAARISSPWGGINYIVPRGMVLPDTLTTTLFYDDLSISRTNAGILFSGWRYRMNSAFDPDPLLGSGAIPGFTELGTLYNAYRVINFDWQVEIANRDTFPIVTYCVPLATDPGANPSTSQTLAANSFGKTQMCSATGGMDRCTFRGTLNLAHFYGNAGFYFDDNYNSGTSTSPAALLFFLIGTETPAVIVNGVTAKVRLGYTIQFNRRTNLTA